MTREQQQEGVLCGSVSCLRWWLGGSKRKQWDHAPSPNKKTGISVVEPEQDIETHRLLLRPLMVAPGAAANTKIFEETSSWMTQTSHLHTHGTLLTGQFFKFKSFFLPTGHF